MRTGILIPVGWAVVAVAFLGGVTADSLRRRGQVPVAIRVGPNAQVSGDRPLLPHVEPVLAIHPANPNHLVVGAIAGRWTCSVLLSTDGGHEWTRTDPEALRALDDCGDPWVAFGRGDTVFLSVLAGAELESGRQTDRVHVFRSPDGGRTWSGPALLPGGAYDHPSIVVDRGDGPTAGELYVLAAQVTRDSARGRLGHVVLSRSGDGGLSFQDPARAIPTNLSHQAGVPVVMWDGTVAFSLYDFATPRGDRLLRMRRLWLVTSGDAGRTLSSPFFVTEISDHWMFPTLAVDPSLRGAFRDRLYTAWTSFGPIPEPGAGDARTAELNRLFVDMSRGVFLAYSSDRGRTWSPPTLVSESADGTIEGRHPAVAASPDGVVGVAWFARDRANPCFLPYFSASLDGGRTFLPAVPVADIPDCPDPAVPGNVVGGFETATRWPAGGDYFGLAADANGAFRAVWADSRTGRYQLWTASITVERPGG